MSCSGRESGAVFRPEGHTVQPGPSLPAAHWADAFPDVPDADHLLSPFSSELDLSFLDAILHESINPTLDREPITTPAQQPAASPVNLGPLPVAQYPPAADATESHSDQLSSSPLQPFIPSPSAEMAAHHSHDPCPSSLCSASAAPAPALSSPHSLAPSAQPTPIHQSLPTHTWMPATITTGNPTMPWSPQPVSIEDLLNNPLNAALLTAQLPKPHRAPCKAPSARPTPATLSNPAPIAKPKRKKLRPHDRLNTLQSHLDTVTARLAQLSMQNRWLERKRHVLNQFVQDLEQHEALAKAIQADIAHHKADPSQPPRGAAVYQLWTPQQFADFQIAHIRTLARLVATIETGTSLAVPPGGLHSGSDRPPMQATSPAAEAALAELEAVVKEVMQTAMLACYGRMDLMPKVIALMGKAAALGVPEEEHWRNVVAAMELTEGQVEEMLVAREVLFSITGKMHQEQEVVQAAISQKAPAAPRSSQEWDDMAELQQDVARKMGTILRRHQSMLLLLIMFTAFRTLTPLQVAKAMVHAHPLMIEAVVILNTLHAQRRPDSTTVPRLGPQPPPMARACTLAGLMQRA